MVAGVPRIAAVGQGDHDDEEEKKEEGGRRRHRRKVHPVAGGLGYPSIPVAVLRERERETSPLNKFITRVREVTCRFSGALLLQGLLTPKAFNESMHIKFLQPYYNIISGGGRATDERRQIGIAWVGLHLTDGWTAMARIRSCG